MEQPIAAADPIRVQARWLVAGKGVVVSRGEVEAAGGRLAAVGGPRPAAGALDLGDAILLPGLVNAHCHLDYTGMAGMIPPPSNFPDWVKQILSIKAHWSYTEFAESWVKGARMLLADGVTTVADIEAVPELLPDVWESTPLRVCSLFEMTGVRSRAAAKELLGRTLGQIQPLRGHPRSWCGLSPHAPYSTPVDLLAEAGMASEADHWTLSIHLSESLEEFEMFTQSRGPLYEWLKPQRSMSGCYGDSPIRLAGLAGALGPRTIAVHCNYLAEGDLELLAGSKTSVAHCPRSHDYFGHSPFQAAALAQAGVNLCLGTDSLASTRKRNGRNPSLSLRAEMRVFAGKHPEVRASEILGMASWNGARALGREFELGELCAGARADFVAIPCPAGLKEDEVLPWLIDNPEAPARVWIDGLERTPNR